MGFIMKTIKKIIKFVAANRDVIGFLILAEIIGFLTFAISEYDTFINLFSGEQLKFGVGLFILFFIVGLMVANNAMRR